MKLLTKEGGGHMGIAYKFSKCAVEEKPSSETIALLEKAAESAVLSREQKNRVAEVLHGTFGAHGSTYCVAGWAWPMGSVLRHYVVKQYGDWHEYAAPDKTSLRKSLKGLGRIQQIVEIPKRRTKEGY